jgi:drug/metabolite transporter (DMT)-like permease
MMANKSIFGISRNLLILHFTVFIWGFTGLLGALITVSALPLVWYRVLIASVSLFAYFKATKTDFKVSKTMLLQLILTGAILGAHWVLFFYSIKLSTVSVTLVCLSSITLWTAITEPLVNKKRISKLEIIAGIIIIAGILLIFKFEVQYTKGIIMGLLSAFCGGLFPVFNSRLVKKANPPVIAFYELSGVFLWVSIFLLFTGGFNRSMWLKAPDVGYLIILGTICTSLAYVAGVSVMREFSAFKVALITNLEPVYGILLAIIFLHDLGKMTTGFWVGALIILGTIILFPVVQKSIFKRKAQTREP